jgi:hypothetical protein
MKQDPVLSLTRTRQCGIIRRIAGGSGERRQKPGSLHAIRAGVGATRQRGRFVGDRARARIPGRVSLRAGPGRRRVSLRAGPGRRRVSLRAGPGRRRVSLRAGPGRGRTGLRAGQGEHSGLLRVCRILTHRDSDLHAFSRRSTWAGHSLLALTSVSKVYSYIYSVISQ